jgi:hypothetical protein
MFCGVESPIGENYLINFACGLLGVIKPVAHIAVDIKTSFGSPNSITPKILN